MSRFERLFLSIKRNGIRKTLVRVIAKIKRIIIPQSYFLNKEFFSDNKVHLAFYPTGGLGDYIISRAVLEELAEDADYDITVFCDKRAFAEAVYGDLANSYVDYSRFEGECYKYDLALWVEHFVHVEGYKKKRLMRLAPKTYRRVEYINTHWKELYVDIPQQCWRERVHFDRCEVLGLNRWTEQRMGQAFSIADMNVDIPLSEEYYDKWKKEFGGTGYITINWGSDSMIPGKTQLKQWPKERYEELIVQFKKEFPNIKIIQLGDKKAIPIRGTDATVFGESLEYTKHILKNSLCHIDCEGGLVHLATQFKTKCIVIFGPTPIHMYAYPQNVNLVNKECAGCMGVHEAWAYECFAKHHTARCMESIAADRVMNELKPIIRSNENANI